MSNKTCTYPGCDEPYCAKGYCMGHYQQARRSGKIKPLKKRVSHSKICVFSGCGRLCYHRQRYCKAHYFQLYRGLSLHPIRPYNFHSENISV